MELFIVDAFTSERFGGNQAGVVLLPEEKEYPADSIMQKIAAELRHSETAFVQSGKDGIFKLRYFTPEGEVPLCGHATISVFTVLREENRITCGVYRADTPAGELSVNRRTGQNLAADAARRTAATADGRRIDADSTPRTALR